MLCYRICKSAVCRPTLEHPVLNHLQHRLPANLLLAAAYAAIGIIGLELSLMPGFSTPLFLPAGLALAALVSGGPRLLPGVALGVLLLNLHSLPNASAVPSGTLAAAALAATAAATLQAYAGMHAFARWVHPAIGAGRDVLRFLALPPALALISSTLSLCALALLGVMPGDALLANWFTWWIGDALGILLGAPLAWTAFGKPRALWSQRRWTVGGPILVLVVLFVAIFMQVRRWEAHQQMQQVQLKAQQASDLLQAKLSEHERYLFAIANAISDKSQHIGPEIFRNIARGYQARHPEILTMGWLKPVAGAERDAFETWARKTVDSTFAIRAADSEGMLHPAPQRDRYVVATYAEPRGNRIYLGLDMLSEPVRAAAVAQALASGEPTASAPITLIQPGRNQGVALLQAVPSGGSAAPGAVMLIALEPSTYLDSVMRQVGFPHLLASLRDEATGAALSPALAGAASEAAFEQLLSFGGRQYRLTLTPTAEYMTSQRGWQSWSVLAAGLVLTSLLGGLLLLTSGEQASVRAQVEASTARLQEREARLQAILEKAADAILTISTDGMLTSANVAAGRLFGHAPESMAGLPLARLLPVGEGDTPADLLRRIAAGNTREHEATGWRSDGAAFPLAVSVSEVEVPGGHLFVAILHDLTEQRRAQDRIHRLAHHDPLTGLENRLSLNLRLAAALVRARRQRHTVAVMFLDLDHFKKINDTHGHQTGDQLLLAVAQRLREVSGEVDTIARLGGDEFIVVTGHVTSDEAGHMAARIVDMLARPYPLQGQAVHSGTSVGIAMYPVDGEDANTLLQHADTAMYAAKSRGRGNFQFFSRDMNAATHERLLLESRLWQALEQQEFELYLQPQIDLASGAVIGAEALLRWHHPELGTVGPDRFIPIAEESGLILPLGEWVLQRAIDLLAHWQTIGLGHLRLAVNLSARQCQGHGLLAQLDRMLAEAGVDPALLELEITESAAMQDPERSRALLQGLRTRGIRVAIDDFGTGYSSLSYLKLFELDRIKIDRGFVKDIESDPNDAAIVSATIGLAHALGLDVIAEGVETIAQADFLRAHHCDEAQGYLFARPMPAAEFERSTGATLDGPVRAIA
ncbi:EAL domain-containing protein [Pseudoduganella umbonata]|uniref:EAL domain-containing protein n=1 Tax=Pseudoduganella umbonata TaxID=864828 RepID=A0ABX5URP9_9BURK|nr:EAL domain-containing protein [Pseudoduganella umbonata]